jgi:putative heme transporter
MVVATAFANWLADAGVLAASLAGIGAAVPWRGLLFAYAVGTAVQGVAIVPGGIGVVEGALTLALAGAGVRHPLALAAVLVYRFVSFWMVISVGWIAYIFVGRPTTAKRPKLALSDGWAT